MWEREALFKACKRMQACMKGETDVMYVHLQNCQLPNIVLQDTKTYPTSATPNKRWTDVAGTHLSCCLIHSSLPTNPSLPLLTQQDDIWFHAWCTRLYLTVQPRVRLHVLCLLNFIIHYNTAMSPIARGSINESKSHPRGFYMHRNTWLMRRSGMARVFGTLLFSFVSWSYRNNAKVAFCLFFKPPWQHQGWNFLLIWHGLCSSTRAQTRRW